MTGTTKLTIAQWKTIQRSVEETGVGVVDITIHPRTTYVVSVEFKTPYGVLKFRVDQHGKRLPEV